MGLCGWSGLRVGGGGPKVFPPALSSRLVLEWLYLVPGGKAASTFPPRHLCLPRHHTV